MSTNEANALDEEGRQRIAAEVLELGQSLFEIMLEAGNHHPAEGQESENSPTEELQGAAQEFFTALRLLLRIEE